MSATISTSIKAAVDGLLPFVIVSLPADIETPIRERTGGMQVHKNATLLSTDFPPTDSWFEERAIPLSGLEFREQLRAVVEAVPEESMSFRRRTASNVFDNSRNDASVDVVRKPKWYGFCTL